MIRHAAALAVVICLSPSWLCAQNTEFTVNAASANVHKGPSTGSPVIGTVPRGRVLSVTRELGSWVRISWAAGVDGMGYVHMSMGRLGRGSDEPQSSLVRPVAGTRPAPDGSLPATGANQASRVAVVQQTAPAGSTALEPTAHLVGVGGRIGGSTLGYGASARASVHDRFGVQVEVSRYGTTSALTQERFTSVQFAPSLLYSLPDKITDYLWLRPYLGGGLTWYRSTLGSATPGAGVSVTDVRVGPQFFGGTELIFAAAPRFSLSADYGHRWSQEPFGGHDLGERGLSISGHWYMK